MTALLNGLTPNDSASESAPATGKADERVLHRISIVRRQQGVSLRSAARQMGTEVSRLRSQEEASSDLRLSDLYQWQRVLDVPIADLLVESTAPLSRPVMERARMVRLMKTATAILDQSTSPATQRMAENLVNQMVEIMPELADISPWHTVGQRRSLDEYGQAFERRIPDDLIITSSGD